MRKPTRGAGKWRVLALLPFAVKVEAPDAEVYEHRPTVRIAQGFNRMFTRIYHQMTVLSPPRLPRKGAAILVCNHVSGLDPMLIQGACSRMIVWMMAKEYYDLKALTWLYKMVEAIPVDRGSRDTSSTRAALRALANGRVLGVFPEGRIETDHELLPFQTGVALMAIKTGVSVYPTYLDGTQRGKEMVPAVTHSNRVIIRFGDPLHFDKRQTSREELEESTQRIQQAVWALRSASLRDKMLS